MVVVINDETALAVAVVAVQVPVRFGHDLGLHEALEVLQLGDIQTLPNDGLLASAASRGFAAAAFASETPGTRVESAGAFTATLSV